MERIKERDRSNKDKWSEEDLKHIKVVNSKFKSYYEGFKDVNPIYLVDASGTVSETVNKIENIIKSNADFI